MTVVHAGSAPATFTGFADIFDGVSAELRRGFVRIEEAAEPLLVWEPAAGEALRLPLSSLREIPDQADRATLVLTSTERPLLRIEIADPSDAAILRRRATHLMKSQPVRGRGRVIGWAAAAVASVALIIFGLVPVLADQLARVLPPEGETALGDVTYEQIQNALGDEALDMAGECSRPAGVAALNKMLDRFGADGLDLPYPLRLTVLDHDMQNAFALPGGRVVVFRGLLDLAESPDEIAAVVAHEIGHVAARDPTRIALRSAGSVGVLGLLLGDFAGGAAVLFLTNQLIQADYTRAAEAQADEFALDLMSEARVDAAALGALFQRLLDAHGDPDGLAEHFMSHPSLGDRIARARTRAVDRPSPVLTPEEWGALQAICGED